MKAERRDLDASARAFVLHRLADLAEHRALPRLLERHLHDSVGPVWTYLSTDFPGHALGDLESGLPTPARTLMTESGAIEIKSVPSKDPVFEHLRDFLHEGDRHYAVLDDPFVGRDDFPERDVVDHVYYADEVYLYLDATSGLDDIINTLGLPPSMLLTGVLTVVPAHISPLHRGHALAEQELTAAVTGVREVFVGAWDGEALVFWKPEPSV